MGRENVENSEEKREDEKPYRHPRILSFLMRSCEVRISQVEHQPVLFFSCLFMDSPQFYLKRRDVCPDLLFFPLV